MCGNRHAGHISKEYANLSVSENISSLMGSVDGKQDQSDQELFQNDSFIQNSS